MPPTAPAAEAIVSDWYEHHFARLVRLAERTLGCTAGAEDVAQEALLRAWEHRGALEHPDAMGPWLTKVAHNLCIDQLRRERETPGLHPDAEPAEPDVPAPDESTAVVRALTRISPRHRDALYMHAFGCATYSDLAARMGVTEPSARMVVMRARRALRAQLQSTFAASA